MLKAKVFIILIGSIVMFFFANPYFENSRYSKILYGQPLINVSKESENTNIENGGETIINVRNYGAKGDGITNDTHAIQEAINSISKLSNTVYIPVGTYLIDSESSLNLKSNMRLIMDKNSILQAMPTIAEKSAIINVADVENVVIEGGIVVGERFAHLGKSGEWGMGINIIGSNGVIIKETKVTDCWGDGFYIGASSKQNFCSDVQLIDVTSDHNRRQGISLISGKNIEIIRPKLLNTGGAAPSAGLDLEPNRSDEYLQNIKVVDCYTENNAVGILVVLHRLNESSPPVDIDISGHSDYKSTRGMSVVSDGSRVSGNVVVNNPVWTESKKNGLAIRNHDYRFLKIDINNAEIINPNVKKNVSKIDSSAVAIYYQPNLKKQIASIQMGNIHFLNPTITGQIRNGFYIGDERVSKIIDISIINPIFVGNISEETLKIDVANVEKILYQ